MGRSLPDTDSVVLRTRCRLSTSENIISSGLYTEKSAGEDEERLWGRIIRLIIQQIVSCVGLDSPASPSSVRDWWIAYLRVVPVEF